MILARVSQVTPDHVSVERERLFRRASRHSRFVQFSRKAIPIGSVLAVGFFAATFFLSQSGRVDRVEAAPPAGLADGKLTMQTPRLTGFQKDQRGYEVTADTASQTLKNQTRIDLALPVARIETAAEGIANIIAKIGVYNTSAESIDLKEKVKIVTDSGYTVLLDRALVDLKQGNLDSERPVVVEMKSGRIEANSMTARNSGSSVLFSGGVTSHFDSLFQGTGAVALTPAAKAVDKP